MKTTTNSEVRVKDFYLKSTKKCQVVNMKPDDEYFIKFGIKWHLFGIREVKDYIFRYGLFIINDKESVIIANSDNIEFLKTYAVTHFAVLLVE